jgi:hypothetical protein
MTKNVVEFPSHRIVRENINNSVIEQAREKSTQKFADSIVDSLIEIMLEEMENFGVDTETESFMKDFSLTVDSLRASVYRTLGIKHHLHAFIDKNVKMMPRDEIPFQLSEEETIDTSGLDNKE